MTTVYYTCSFVPSELISACGCVPQRLISVCKNSRLSGTEGMCSFTEAWLQDLLDRPETEDFAAIFTTSCDQMRRAFDLYCHQSGRKALLLNVPSTRTPQALDYYRQELERLRTCLCTLSGKSFDENRLKKLMLGCTSKKDKPENKERIQIAFVGGPVPASIRSTVNTVLQTSNGSISFNTAENMLIDQFLEFNPVQTRQDPFKELTAGYFQLPAIWKRPNDLFYDWFTRKLRKNKIDGIILFRHLFCDLWHSQVYEFKNRFDIPVLDINLDGKASLSASAVSRIQAFLETLAA